jgi:hypothetical protein
MRPDRTAWGAAVGQQTTLLIEAALLCWSRPWSSNASSSKKKPILSPASRN